MGLQAVIASYEVKQEEAQLEIRDLKAALSNLQSEYRYPLSTTQGQSAGELA